MVVSSYIVILNLCWYFLAGNGVLLEEEIEDDAASTAFCCVGNGEETPLHQAGEEIVEL